MTAPESNHSLTNLNVLRRNNLLCNADFFFLIETVGNNGLTLDTAVSRGIYMKFAYLLMVVGYQIIGYISYAIKKKLDFLTFNI